MPIASTAPSAVTALVGTPSLIALGISDSDPQAGTLNVSVTASAGTLQTGGSGGTIAGAGTGALVLSGSQTQVNADLSQIVFTDGSAGTASIALSELDSDGNALTRSVAVTI